MGYSIRYGSDVPEALTGKHSGFGLIGVVAVILVCAISFGFSIAEEPKDFLYTLVPWLEPSVQEAFGVMREEIRNGESFSDAFAGLFRQLTESGGYAA